MDILTVMLAAALTDNAVFARLLADELGLGANGRLRAVLQAGLLTAVVMMLSVITVWAADHYVLAPLGAGYLTAFLCAVVAILLSWGAGWLLKKFAPALCESLGAYVPLAAVNCAVVGVALITTRRGGGFIETAAFGAGSALGYLLAVAVLAGVRERMELSESYALLGSLVDSMRDSRQKQIIKMRYGFNGKTPLTQREVAEILGISRSYVSRIEKKALEELEAQIRKNAP